MLLSLIIPFYNSSKYLEECIISLLNQSCKNFEAIFIDGGSTDNSCDIIAKYVKYGNFKIIKNKHAGVSYQRNLGMTIAKGRYISFIDSDDVVDPEYIRTLVNNINKYGSDIVIVGYKEFEHFIPHFANKNNITNVLISEDNSLNEFYSSSYKKGYLISCAKAYKRKKINGITFDERIGYGEDTDFNFELFKKRLSITISDSILYYYRFHNDNVVLTPNSNIYTNFIGLQKHIEYILNNYPNDYFLVYNSFDSLYWFLNDSYLFFRKAKIKYDPFIFKKYKKYIIANKKSYHINLKKAVFLLFPNFYFLLKHLVK